MSVPSVAVGTPASGFEVEDWKTVRILFHGFTGLTTTKGACVMSPEFTLFGHQWRVKVYPGGHDLSSNGMIAVGLCMMSAKSITLDLYGFSIKKLDGDNVSKCSDPSSLVCFGQDILRSFPNFAHRSDALSALVAGTLIIEVQMRCTSLSINSPPFVAENPSLNMVRKMFRDEKSADVVFEVEEDSEQIPDSRKRSRAEPVKFHAHRLILKQCAPMLAALCPPGEGVVSAAITDMAPEVFQPLLFYLYGGEVSEEDYKSHAREIIRAADRFAIVGLKLAAEAWYAQSTKIDLDNVMELLLYADAKNLALLKEAAMDFVVDNGKEVLKRVPKEVPGGLFADLLAAMTRGKQTSEGEATDLNSMRISELRKMLHGKGLGIDGSREMLIAALEKNK